MIKDFIKDLAVSSVDVLIPVTDKTIIYDRLPRHTKETQIYFEFFDVNEDPITPTAGTITTLGSPMGNIFLAPSSTKVLNATEVSTVEGTYTPVHFNGFIDKLSFVFAGITGASFVKIMYIQY